MKRKSLKSLLFISLTWSSLVLGLLNLSSCGKNAPNQVVSDVKINTLLINGEVNLDVSAIFNLGNASMTALNVSIIDPRNPDESYGSFRILPTLDFKSEIGISVNLSHAARIPGGAATLPNGSAIPIGGLDQTQLVQLQLQQMNARIYFAFSPKTFLLGFALPIKEFDVVSKYVGMANIFPGFDIKGVRGMAGLFTGLDPGTSGLAFFLDLSSVINSDVLNKILNGERIDSLGSSGTQGVVKSASSSQSNLNFTKGMTASKAKMNKVQQVLEKMMVGEKRQLHYFFIK